MKTWGEVSKHDAIVHSMSADLLTQQGDLLLGSQVHEGHAAEFAHAPIQLVSWPHLYIM